MNAELAVHGILLANAAVQALVGERIYPGVIKAGTPYPCITYQRIGENYFTAPLMAAEDPDACDVRIQVTVWGKNYKQCKLLTKLARKALRRWKGTIDDVVVWDITLESGGPDLYDPALDLYGVPVDYLISLPE